VIRWEKNKMVTVKINNEGKKWYQSKTVWINALLFMSALAAFVGGEVEAGSTLTVASIVNFALRFYTTQQIKQ